MLTAVDRIEISGLRVTGRHGVYEHERSHGQVFVVDAVLTVDTRRAAATDDLADTVDYATLSDRLAAIVAGEPVRLVERLAERLAQACLAEPGVREVAVTVHKPQASLTVPVDDIAVTVHRRGT